MRYLARRKTMLKTKPGDLLITYQVKGEVNCRTDKIKRL